MPAAGRGRASPTNNKWPMTVSDRIPLGDTTNTQASRKRTRSAALSSIPEAGVDVSGVSSKNIDPMERKRKYARDWYTAMSDE
ncbi:unnamed protein product [Urochloa humidicola]